MTFPDPRVVPLSFEAEAAIRSAGLFAFKPWLTRRATPARKSTEIVDEVLERHRRIAEEAREAEFRLTLRRFLRSYGVSSVEQREIIDRAVGAWRSGRS
jgi:hypothetical protein